MSEDWTDRQLERWADLQQGVDMGTYQVTARISRAGQHLARSQERVFARFGLNRGEVGLLGALRTAGADRRMSPTELCKGLMLSSAGVTSRLDRLEKRGPGSPHTPPERPARRARRAHRGGTRDPRPGRGGQHGRRA